MGGEGDGRLVGRVAECLALERLLDRLTGGVPRLVEVTGEPGIGKTRLLAELAQRARRRGDLVLTGRASEYDGSTAFAVLIDALDGWLRGLDPAHRRSLTGADAGVLAGVFPAVAAESATVDRVTERHRLHWAVRALLERLGRTSRVVLVFDDAHWFDPSTVELLAHLVRRPPRGPILLALGYRHRQAPAHLLAALGGRTATRLRLGPLTQEEAAELLEGVPGRFGRQAIHRDSGGNPFYLLALARAGTQTGAPPGPEIDDIPPAVRQAILAETAALGARTVAVAQAAAVADGDFDTDLVAAIAEVDRAGIAGAIDELVARDMVRPAGPGQRFRYRHPLLRHVIYLTADAGWRLGAHARAAATLGRRGDPLDDRAVHVERSALPGDGAAIELLVAAARQVLWRAPAIAAHRLAAALALQHDRTARVDLLIELAHARGLAGDLTGSRATMDEVLGLLPRHGAAARTQAVVFCAMVERLLGLHAESRARLLAEFEALAGAEFEETASLAIELSFAGLMRGDFPANRSWALRALELARRFGSRPIEATALGFLAMNSYGRGEVRHAAARLDEAALLVDGMPDHELAKRIDATLWLGWNETYLERYRDAVRHLERGLRLVNMTGQVYLLPLLLACLDIALRWQGRLVEAARYAEEAVDAAYLSGSAELRCIALAVTSWIASWTGDVALAVRSGRAAVATAEPLSGWFTTVAAAMLARARLAADDPGDAVEQILAQFGGPDLPAADPWTRMSWWEVLVRGDIAQGHVDRAAGYAERAEALAARLGLAGHTGLARLARAQVLAAEGSRDQAAAHAVVAVGDFTAAGCRLEAGRAHLLAGTTLTDPDQARHQLELARSVFAGCGARGLRLRAVRELNRIARPPADGPGIGGLTARELEVANLVTDGLTNAQIARRLGVTAKTVEKHLAQLFGKLDVPSRAGVASVVTRALAGTPPATP
ncbi:MAG TPA: AAA family ATPase [Actinophytocola sp.]|uniref:helix-turn-helix transcriptional regulator n=1 Tax=Actinophytocola sp. TaxID=1872138 RepID=UPI002DBB9C8C|nr:AAA family ATPase [Actinophytocola sp.]HEU5469246.1 AAA family ATPase [Actinophytocola sp.]